MEAERQSQSCSVYSDKGVDEPLAVYLCSLVFIGCVLLTIGQMEMFEAQRQVLWTEYTCVVWDRSREESWKQENLSAGPFHPGARCQLVDGTCQVQSHPYMCVCGGGGCRPMNSDSILQGTVLHVIIQIIVKCTLYRKFSKSKNVSLFFKKKNLQQFMIFLFFFFFTIWRDRTGQRSYRSPTRHKLVIKVAKEQEDFQIPRKLNLFHVVFDIMKFHFKNWNVSRPLESLRWNLIYKLGSRCEESFHLK